VSQSTRLTSATHDVAETYVTTESCYAAIYDEASPVNVKGFIEQEIEASRQQIDALGKDRGFILFDLNGRLMDRARRGELLAWTLVFDGVFRAVIEVAEPLGSDESPTPLIDNLGGPLVADLVCPSGRLVVGCLSRLGERQTPTVTVEPGTYRVRFTFDEKKEVDKHMLVQARSDYPLGVRPDWTFRLNRMQS
jgi:hypothetical protein